MLAMTLFTLRQAQKARRVSNERLDDCLPEISIVEIGYLICIVIR